MVPIANPTRNFSTQISKSRSSFQNRGRGNDWDRSGGIYTIIKRSDNPNFSGQRKFEPQSSLARARTISVAKPKLINKKF